MKEKEKLRIEWGNDVGPNDDYYYEFWSVYEGDKKLCECTSEEDAIRILNALGGNHE